MKKRLNMLSSLGVLNSFPFHRIKVNKGPANKSNRSGPDLECIECPEWNVAAQPNIKVNPKTPINGSLFICK